MQNWKRNTAIFLSSQAISLFGSALVQYAIMWHITLTTQSGVHTTIAIVCGFLPTLFLSPFAGVWADRYNRKLLIVLADGGIALATLVLALLFMAGHQYLWLLYVVMAVRALGGAVQTPCISAIMPQIVPAQQLTRVNGINTSIQSAITLVSPLLSGALMGFASLQVIFFIDVVTAALAIVLLLTMLRLPQSPGAQAKAKAASSYFLELKQGMQYIFSRPWLRHFFLFFGLLFLVIGPLSFLTPLQVARNYGDDVWRLTAIEMAFALGMMAGGLVVAAWGGFANRVKTIALGGLVMGLFSACLAFPLPFWVYVLFMALVGILQPNVNTPAIVLLQEQVDPAYMGRVFSILTMITSSITPLGMLVFGPLADRLPIERLLAFTGLAIVLISVLIYTNGPLRQAGGWPARSNEAQNPEAPPPPSG